MPATRAALTVALLLAVLSVAACDENGEIKVSSLKFEGVSQVSKGALANALKTKKGSRLPWGRKRYFDQRDFDADLKRIQAFYQDHGFPDARVTSFDLDLNDEQTAIDVTVRISEGEPIKVAEVVYEGFDVLPDRQQRRLRRRTPLEAGQPMDRQLAATSRERAVTAFKDNGYPYAVVRLSNEPVGERLENVVLRATPGTLAHFGPVEITGQASVNDEVIRRQLVFDPGDEFSQQKLRDSQTKLYGLELFQFVNIETVEGMAQEQPAEVPIRVTLAESKHRKLTFSAGYGSEEHIRARVRWDHVNFLGNARHLGLEARWSSLDRGVRAEFKEPYLFNPRLSMNFEGQWWNAEEPVYSQKTAGGRVVLRHQTNERLFWSVSLINEYQTSTITEEARNDPELRDELISLGLDPRTGESSGTVGAIAFDIGRNTTNNLLDARRGYVLNLHLEQAGSALWGSYNYRAAGFEGRYFRNVAGLFVVATRLSGGVLDPTDNLDANIPFHKRFFIGGASSNRGWGRYEISPLEEGLPIGGLSMLDGSTEVRFPVFGKLGAVAFVDYGNVWEGIKAIDFSDLRFAVGPGFRYQTPIGPARIDLGYQLNPIAGLLVDGEEQKRQWRVHFSVGQAF